MTVFLISPPGAWAGVVVGSCIADVQGDCAIDVPVDPGAEAQFVADEFKDYLELTNNCILQSISVQNGVAHNECTNAIPDSTVEASLPPDVANAIGVPGAVVDGEISTAAKVGAAALSLTGLGFGSAALAGAFDSDDELVPTGER